LVKCEHEFKKVKLKWFFFTDYSKCLKCGIIRHDKDGDMFYPSDLKDAYNKGKVYRGKK